jgi:hypothetical protein
MASRSNACSELVRFWLETRHPCFVRERIPVRVPFGHSDIDFAAIHPRNEAVRLPSGVEIGPRLIVESKDEHDWDPSGKGFGMLLRGDILKMGADQFVPAKTKEIKFSMLRQEHFQCATELFGTNDFDRLFVTHAIDSSTLRDMSDALSARRIHWLTISDVVRDLLAWYEHYPHPTTLRNTATGDLVHLLVGFCNLKVQYIPRHTDSPA